MKLKLYVLLSVIASFFINELSAQAPGVRSVRYYAGSFTDYAVFDSKLTHDKGFVFAVLDTIFGTMSQSNVLDKPIIFFAQSSITKVDSAGKQLWRTSTLSNSTGRSVEVCSDGGYIMAGSSVITPDSAAFMIMKVNSAGTTEWTDRLGGTGEDGANSIIEVSQGGYIVVGNTRSTDGDVAGNHGTTTRDVWVVRLNAGGSILWKKCFGGLQDDNAFSVLETPDHGFIVAGSSASADGDLTANKGARDGWLFKIDGAGNMQWQKNIGGTQDDFFRSLAFTEDGAVIAVGNTASADGDISGNHGQNDAWVVKCSTTGNIIWSKCFGGTLDEFGTSIERTLNNEYLVGGFTNSTDGDVSFNNGGSDGWMLLVSAAGNLIWQKTVGTVNNDYGTAANVVRANQFTLVGTGPKPPGSGRNCGLLAFVGNSNTIKGNVFLDANSNGTKDNGETAYNDALVKINNGGLVASAVPYNGKFSVDVELGSFITSLTANSPYYTVSPSSHASNFASYFNVDSFDFAVQPIPLQRDLAISTVALTPARPGFNVSYQVFYNNIGTENISNAIVSFVIDAKTSFVSATPTPSTVSGNTLQWNIASLNALQSGSIVINLKVATPPTVNNGNILQYIATIDPVSGDLTPSNDTARLKQVVTGSYDPNDKKEVNAGKITPKQITDGEYLTYLIRFQNTGTDTAFTINVRDTLDTQLDWNTLQMISTSHAYNLQVKDGNKITWTFDDIKLVDSNHNEPASHGYIAYRIKPKATLVNGDIINNTAAIYFDFNLPVQTNREQTQVGDPTPLPVKLGRFQVYLKRDKTVQVEWQSLEELNTSHFEIERSTNGYNFVSIGKVPAKNAAGGAAYSLVDNKPSNGINYYRLKTTDADGKNGYSAVVKINLQDKPLIITTLYPNPAGKQFRLDIKGAVKGNASIALLNNNGQVVLTKDLGKLDTDSVTIPIGIGNLAPGLYTLRLQVNATLYKSRLIVQ